MIMELGWSWYKAIQAPISPTQSSRKSKGGEEGGGGVESNSKYTVYTLSDGNKEHSIQLPFVQGASDKVFENKPQ